MNYGEFKLLQRIETELQKIENNELWRLESELNQTSMR